MHIYSRSKLKWAMFGAKFSGGCKRGICCILGVCIIQAMLGCLNSSGNSLIYVTSYLKYQSGYDDIEYTTVVWMFQTNKLFFGISTFVGAIISHFIHPRIVILIGCLLTVNTTALTGLFLKYSLVLVFIVSGALFGIGVGIAYTLSIKQSQLWFPEYNGIINGITACCFSLGTLFTNFMQTLLINPHNYTPDTTYDSQKYFDQDEVLSNVPQSFYILAAIYGATAIVGLALISDPITTSLEQTLIHSEAADDEEKATVGCATPLINDVNCVTVSENESQTIEERKNTGEPSPKSSGLELSLKEAMTNKSYHCLIFYVVVSSYIQILFINYYKSYGQTFISDDHFLTLVGSVASMIQALGCIVWGAILDYTSCGFCVVISSASLGILSITIQLCEYLSKGFYLIWICVVFFHGTAVFVVVPTATARAFGLKNFGLTLGVLYCIRGLFSLVSTELISLVLNTKGWTTVFLVCAASLLLSEMSAFAWSMHNLKGSLI